MMNKISETQTLTTVRLSDAQKMVMTKIIAAATPQTALNDISDGRNLVEARNILGKLGLIAFTGDDARVTDEGKAVMKDENLIDDTDQLTDEGQQYSQVEHPEDLKDKEQGMEPPEEQPTGDEFDFGGGEEAGGEEDLGLGESFSFLREIARNEIMKRKINEMNQAPEFSPNELNIIKRAAKGDDDELSSELMDKIFEWIIAYDPVWMPYGTQKARTGDPHEWIYSHLSEIANLLTR